MEWIHDEYSVVAKHQLLEFGMRGICWETWEEIAEVSKSLIVWRSILNLYFEEIEVFPA